MDLLRRAAICCILSIACVSTAVAARRSNASAEDCGQSAPKAAAAASAPAHANAPVALPLVPGEDNAPTVMRNVPLPATPHRTDYSNVPSTDTPGAHTPSPADRPADRRAPRKSSPASSVRTTRPGVQRAKAPLRQMPATPGMGTLLRFGITVGKEVSWSLEGRHDLMISLDLSGRAPPRAGPHSNSSPAAWPVTQHFADARLTLRTATHLPASTNSTLETMRRRFVARDFGCVRAAGPGRTNAIRPEGAAAWYVAPSGGSAA